MKDLREYWSEKFPDRSKWSYPDLEILARYDPFYRHLVAIEVRLPAPMGTREGMTVTITPDQARQLARQLIDSAEVAPNG